LVLVLLSVLILGCGKESVKSLSKLVLVGPPSPAAIPLAYIAENDRLSDIAEETELVVAENLDQLRALVAGGDDVHFASMPSNLAANLYNRGIGLQLLEISLWGGYHVVSTDPEAQAIQDLQGKEVVVHCQGMVPDLVFQYICKKSGLDIPGDLSIYYANSPQQAAQLLLAGKKDYVFITEPLTTQVVMKGRESGLQIHRSIDIQVEWGKASGLGERIPRSGAVALPAIQDSPDTIKRFLTEYKLAVEWMIENPVAAGQLASEIEELGFEAGPMTESINNTPWGVRQARECRGEVEAFLTAIAELDPKVIGGQLPDDGFYYEGVVLK